MKSSFLLDHFDHILLTMLAILSAAAGLWCDLHKLDGGKFFYGQATGFTGALMLRMNGARGGNPPPPPPINTDSVAPVPAFSIGIGK